MKPIVYILCGLPASGKSSWILKNKKINAVKISLDDIRRDIFGHQFFNAAEPWVLALAKTFTRLLLKQGKNIVIDSTALMRFMRSEWKSIADQYGASTILVYFDVSYDTCYKRNIKRDKSTMVPDEAMIRLLSIFEKPNLSLEKYNKVIRIKEPYRGKKTSKRVSKKSRVAKS
jgi:predicted kinase